MGALHYSVAMTQGLLKKAKLTILKTVFVPVLIYGHEFWAMTVRVRSQVQASEIRFLQRIEKVTLLTVTRCVDLRFENL